LHRWVVLVAFGCARPALLTPQPIAGRWDCGSYGELIVFDRPHYTPTSTNEIGHFSFAANGHEFTFEPDGPLEGEIGRWKCILRAAGSFGPVADASSCTFAGPGPRFPSPDPEPSLPVSESSVAPTRRIGILRP
jgi:hypothetical protein